MLKHSQQFLGLAVASLHTGVDIDRVRQIIINPYELSVAGFYLQDSDTVLLVSDIREVGPKQIIIDSEDVLTDTEDLLRLEKVLKLNYELIGNSVRTKSKQKLGSVEEYIIDDVSWKIQKIHVKQPMWRNLTGATLIVDRRQVVEISEKLVVVEDTLLRANSLAAQQVPQ